MYVKLADILMMNLRVFICMTSFHPEYRDFIRNRLLNWFDNEEVTPTFEFKLLTKTGEGKWVRSNSELMDYEAKKPDPSIIIDINELKKVESELKKSVSEKSF